MLWRLNVMNEFETLVDAYYQPLYRFGYSLAKNPERAADLVQQTFVKWAEKGHQLKDRSKAKSWLFTTLYREHLSQARRASRFSDQELEEVKGPDIPSFEPNTERQLDGKRAVALLGQLDENFRAPLTLFYLKEHSYKEIAAILDIPIGTVMSRIARGKGQLKGLMETAVEMDSENVVKFSKESA